MCQLIEQLANETGISIDQADQVCKAISKQLETKIPAFKQLMEDILENVEADKLKEHINKAIVLLQLQSMDTFKTWLVPDQSHIRIHKAGSHSIF